MGTKREEEEESEEIEDQQAIIRHQKTSKEIEEVFIKGVINEYSIKKKITDRRKNKLKCSQF